MIDEDEKKGIEIIVKNAEKILNIMQNEEREKNPKGKEEER